MADPIAVAAQALDDIRHMLDIAWRGPHSGVLCGYEKGNLVPTGITADNVTGVVIPLLIGLVLAALWTTSLEAAGYATARMTGVGSKLQDKIAAARAKGNDVSDLERKYNIRHQSFAAAFTEAVFYSVDLFIAWRICGAQTWAMPWNWLDPTDGSMSDITRSIAGVPAMHSPRELRAFYAVEFGFYVSQLLSVLTKKRKKDFWQMVAHHVITATLIGWSYTFGALRVGIIIMVCHSSFDPFLNMAKCFHYIFSKDSTGHLLADINFALAAITFAVFRFGLLPLAILATIWPEWKYADVNPNVIYVSRIEIHVLRVLLCALLPIHVFWFKLILKVLTSALSGGTVQGDNREDDDDDDDDDGDADDAAAEGKKDK
mmetsp:Transcript_21826/g.56922  ORF Transcript_21826/g.56922 Transcript_21826/m.56922 type:complete len:373 (+) Transcript_21826:276-1394(+)